MTGLSRASYYRWGVPRPSLPVEMELRLQSLPSEKDNKLRVTLVFHPPTRAALQDAAWRDNCNKVFCEVRSYLMGSSQG